MAAQHGTHAGLRTSLGHNNQQLLAMLQMSRLAVIITDLVEPLSACYNNF
jgi:hypothetical protein